MTNDAERARILRAELSRADKVYEEAKQTFETAYCQYVADNHRENVTYLRSAASPGCKQRNIMSGS